MDAMTVAAAALAVAVDESRDAAHRAALLELEHKAMYYEDLILTWRRAYERIELSRAHLFDALREVRQALRAGDHNHTYIEVLIDHHIGDDP